MKKRIKPRAVHYTLFYEMCASPTDPLPEAWQRTQLTSMWDGLAMLETGTNPGCEDWAVCSDAVNLFETLVSKGPWSLDDKQSTDADKQWAFIKDESGLLIDALTSLAQSGQRHKAGHALRLSGQGIQSVRAVLEDYAAVAASLPARAMIRCHRLTEMRINAILAGKNLLKNKTVTV